MTSQEAQRIAKPSPAGWWGWQPSRNLRTDLALDALDMELWAREHAGHDTTGVIAHADKGVHLAVRYTQRLAEAGAVASVGSTGDSYDCEHNLRVA